MIDLGVAQARVVDQCAPLAGESVAIDACLGLVTAEPVIAADAVPPFANTGMDGFAVRAADVAAVPTALRITGTLAAGADPASVAVGPGEAVRIMTGAGIPPGADAVVMVERTTTSEDSATVTIAAVASAGDHIRPAGEDVAPGQVVVEAATVLGPGHLGVLASVGRATVVVHRRPRVGVLSTGDELVEPDRTLGPGQIRDANRHSLLALVAETGCTPVDLGIVVDDEAVIDDAIGRGVGGCDALITTGGVSMGDFDYVKAVLDRRSSGAMSWMQVAIKPAKPLSFGLVDGTPVFGLPGNPVSSMVSFELFARPGLRRLMGHPTPFREPVTGVAAEALGRHPDGKVHFVRVACAYDDAAGRWLVRSAGGQASNLLMAMAAADGLAVLPDGDGVGAGEPVGLLLLGPR